MNGANRILIIGNSGSGKSSMAKRLAKDSGLPHLDLDDIAWRQSDPPMREASEKCNAAIDAFIVHNPGWIMEGCYASLVLHAGVPPRKWTRIG